ncbi:MAG TPA: hypothetical protein VF857_05440, partial [Spirochaetota bacterium]
NVAIPIPSSKGKSAGIKKNYGREIAGGFVSIVLGVSRSVKRVFQNIALVFTNKLRPVKEEESGQKKSLIDDYMREYERKKHR